MVLTLRKVSLSHLSNPTFVNYRNYEIALKSEALAWRFTGDPTDVQNTFDRIDMVYEFHGRASGASLDTSSYGAANAHFSL